MFGLEAPRGVTIVRRDFIRMSAGALGTLLLGGCAAREALPAPPKPITWDEFKGELVPRAESLLAQKMSEDDYVRAIVMRLEAVDRTLIPASAKDLPRHKLFTVTEFKLTEGRGFKHHDHRNYNGVIFVLDGAVRCTNFDIVGDNRTPAAGAPFRIRRTASILATVGQSSTLTSVRDNVHDVHAAAGGCRLLDIFTWIGPKPRSVYMTVGDAPVDAEGREFEARFTS